GQQARHAKRGGVIGGACFAVTAPDFERLAFTPCPMASLASSGIKALSSLLARSWSRKALRVLRKSAANSAQELDELISTIRMASMRGRGGSAGELQTSAIGKVVTAAGSVTIEHASAVVVQANIPAGGVGQTKAGDLVYKGDVVQTGADG